jgi:hypothetical protein
MPMIHGNGGNAAGEDLLVHRDLTGVSLRPFGIENVQHSDAAIVAVAVAVVCGGRDAIDDLLNRFRDSDRDETKSRRQCS